MTTSSRPDRESPSGRDELGARLARIVAGYGRHALADPVALRAAWRATGDGVGEPPEELLAVSRSTEIGGLTGPREALDGVTARIAAESGRPVGSVGPVVRALADVLAAPRRSAGGAVPADAPATTADPTGPPETAVPGEVAGSAEVVGSGDETRPPRRPAGGGDGGDGGDGGPRHRILWDDDDPEPDAVAPARRWRVRRVAAVAGVALVVVVAVVATLLVTRTEPGTPLAEDRYGVAAVADRYRALGASLLDGAQRCAPGSPASSPGVPASPGEAERVDCEFDGLVLTLRTFDTTAALAADRAVPLPPDALRSVRRGDGGADVAMVEQRDGRSTVRWDAEIPRPVAATVTGTRSLVDVAAFFRDRRFALGRAPEVPGPMFRSGALWSLAAPYVYADPGVRCAPAAALEGQAERVQCDLPNDGRASFTRPTDRAALRQSRDEYADDYDVRPGTKVVGPWDHGDGRYLGQYSTYVDIEGRPVVYWDDETLGVYGVLFGPIGSSQDALRTFWSGLIQPG